MLVEHAKRELELVGLFDKGSDYDGMVGTAVVELMEVFAKQGHSGESASQTIYLFHELARYKPLSPITSNPAEWTDMSDLCDGVTMWQSKRNPSVFSKDGGQTWYDLNEKKE